MFLFFFSQPFASSLHLPGSPRGGATNVRVKPKHSLRFSGAIVVAAAVCATAAAARAAAIWRMQCLVAVVTQRAR